MEAVHSVASLAQPLYFADILGNLTLFIRGMQTNEEEIWYLLYFVQRPQK